MTKKLSDIIHFRGDRLFNGAVNIEWFCNAPDKAELASQSFVFHGPKYHGVTQQDIGESHGHRLIDTASFARAVVRRCYGIEEQPFTLAIAGYGTGKSHLGLTLAKLLSSPRSDSAIEVIEALRSADDSVTGDISATIREAAQPCLVVTLNGMRGFDLSAELTKQLSASLKRDGHDTKYLDELRPRFGQAISLIEMSNEAVKNELLEYAQSSSISDVIHGLKDQDEFLYTKVYEFFNNKGMPIRVLAGESIRDVIDLTVRDYCGVNKPYRSLLILFDEFGKYTEFATIRSQIAGSGVLQELFEAVQSNSTNVCLVGFIQFELSAYVKRIAPEYRNEILRYITRYQSADRLYLSINLETLIANLIEKKQPALIEQMFDGDESIVKSNKVIAQMQKWFPSSKNYRLWSNQEQFHSTIIKGCWPLSPYSTWLLFFLASAGKHLQERSALALLGDSFNKFKNTEFGEANDWSISPVDLFSENLLNEILISEKSDQQGSIAHSYSSVLAKHGSKFTPSQIRVLKAILLASKLGLVANDKSDAVQALSELSAVSVIAISSDVAQLQEEYNVIEWDEAFKAFDILGDAVPRTQFLAFIRQRVSNTFDESSKASLFASKASEWCELLTDVDCDFSEENRITTREWKFQSISTNLDYLAQQIKLASDQWVSAIEVDQPRGTVIYCYAEPSRTEAELQDIALKTLKRTAKEIGVSDLPVIVVYLHDSDGFLGQLLAENAILEEISEEEKAKFGNLIAAHKEKLLKSINESAGQLIKKRIFITSVDNPEGVRRLTQIGFLLFTAIYKKPISFPFDGFKTARGNAATTCHELTYELIHGKLDYNSVLAKPDKTRNRAITVLKDNWGIFNKDGSVSRRPAHSVIRSLTMKWDDKLGQDQKLPILESIKEVCRPPYGANIASAGLFLGVFIAPRIDKLVVMKDGVQLSISQWVHDNVFRGKYLNLASLQAVDLMQIGEASSEWENLLDEWEQSSNHYSRMTYLERSIKLKERTPIPPTLVYREDGLKKLSINAYEEINKLEKKKEKAWDKIDAGYKRQDCSLISWGAADIKQLHDKVEEEIGLWSASLLDELSKDYSTARQYALQIFESWLTYQGPESDSPSDIGDFKHKMLRLVGTNLQRIGLTEEFVKLENYTKNAIKNAETIAEVKQLIRTTESWLDEKEISLKTKSIVEARVMKEKGVDFSKRLQKASNKVEIPEIIVLRERLSGFVEKVSNIEKELFQRASSLWNLEIVKEDDLDRAAAEIDSLILSFDGLGADLDDLLSMKKAIKIFRSSFAELANLNLTWPQLLSVKDELQKRYQVELEEEEVPWSIEDVLENFYLLISEARNNKSKDWFDEIIEYEQSLNKMSASDANRLLQKISSPPPYLNSEHESKLNDFKNGLTQHLATLNVEWLIEKFKELSIPKRVEFIEMAQKHLD